MKISSPEHKIRLALLLAGGGARCRRHLSDCEMERDVLEFLKTDHRLKRLCTKVSEMDDQEVDRILDQVREQGWRWIVPADKEYPELLTETADPPLGLFVRGRLDENPRVAVVGSRKATSYGREVTRLFAADMARMGIVLVSGMARGIDQEAHQSVITHGGRTFAVWGAGPDRIYPAEHRDLAEKIAANGALITEYPPGTPPRKHHFPERNRLIAGLSSAVVVVEAAVRSGALVTARLAIEEGRDVLAVPGSILSEMSVGPNALIRMGARPLLTARDIAEVIGIDPQEPGDAPVEDETALLGRLEVLTVDEITARSDLDLPLVLSRLLELELAGDVEQMPDGRYRRC